MFDLGAKMVQTLGADLRALRKARGLTLSELAATLGKSVGWVSQVERDLSNPTINDLRALSKALDVPLSLFFGDAEAATEEQGLVVRANSRRALGQAEAGLTEELLSPDLTDDFEMLRSVFAAKSKSETHVSRPTQELAHLISGRLNVTIGDKTFNIEPGDTFRIRGEAYAWENPYDAPAVAIWVIAPPVY